MAQETIFGDGSEDVIGEVVKALESAGVTGDIAAAVTNNLITVSYTHLTLPTKA